MAISFSRYIDITSGLGGVSPATQRDLIGRFFTNSIEIPTGSVVEFSTAQQVTDFTWTLGSRTLTEATAAQEIYRVELINI